MRSMVLAPEDLMPVVSKAQNRFMHEMAEHPDLAKQHGMKAGVAEEFVNSMHGKSVKSLPERVGKAEGGAVTYPRNTKW